MLTQLLRWSSLSTVLTASFASMVNAQSLDYSNSGLKAVISWRCAALANESSSHLEEVGRLFDLGYPLMASVVDALRDGRVPEDQLATLPLLIPGNLVGGPNTDFELGVIWSVITARVSKELSEGLPKFIMSEYALANELRKVNAGDQFRDSSCAFID